MSFGSTSKTRFHSSKLKAFGEIERKEKTKDKGMNSNKKF
tara:strand:+ start:464 stop:583 length:120 start_codon:yes stop_codon:yes gene_type:complete